MFKSCVVDLSQQDVTFNNFIFTLVMYFNKSVLSELFLFTSNHCFPSYEILSAMTGWNIAFAVSSAKFISLYVLTISHKFYNSLLVCVCVCVFFFSPYVTSTSCVSKMVNVTLYSHRSVFNCYPIICPIDRVYFDSQQKSLNVPGPDVSILTKTTGNPVCCWPLNIITDLLYVFKVSSFDHSNNVSI